MSDAPVTEETVEDVPEQMKIRREKRDRLLAGKGAYPVAVPKTHELAQVRAKHKDLEAGQETDDVVSVAGRVVFVRLTGKLCFAAVQAGDGTRLQLMLSLKEVGEEQLAAFKSDVDLGDIVSATGRVICSKRGELSLMVTEWQMASKSLRPLPVLHKEMSEEARVRQRYADLIVRPAAQDMARLRPAVVRSIRDTMHSWDYVEVETPMLQTMHGGAAARPFSTEMNALSMELFLRIAPELFLKRALVGGIDRVFEINRNFRNEGMDSTHSPEFAMLEFYEAYSDYHTAADRLQQIIQNAVNDAYGRTDVELPDGSTYDFGGDWERMEMYPSLSAAVGEEITPETDLETLKKFADKFDLELDPKHATHGKYIEELWEATAGADLWAPTFVTNFPTDTSPLTKEHRSIPGVVEKWDLYVRGFELGTGYSELNDPIVQRERFEAQAALAARGDAEAMGVDEDFLRALEYGMPPAGGVGMGIDRLLMALTGEGVRETILFPLVKPE